MKAQLQAARALIHDPERWLHVGVATTAVGRAVSIMDPCAWCFCIGAAIKRQYGESPDVLPAWAHLARTIGLVGDQFTDIGVWNDHPRRTHAEVLAALDAAIESAPE